MLMQCVKVQYISTSREQEEEAYLVSWRLWAPRRSHQSSRYTRQRDNHRVYWRSGSRTVCSNAPRVPLARTVCIYSRQDGSRLAPVHQQRRRAVTDSDAHRITILSSISSTPARRSEAKTGGMERARLALTTRNSLGLSDARDFPLFLGDFGFNDKASSGAGATVVSRFSFFFFFL